MQLDPTLNGTPVATLAPGPALAFVSLPGPGATDRFLSTLADAMSARGLRLAGTVQTNILRPGRLHCDMDLKILPDGPVFRVSDDRGNEARGCRLDADALEAAAAGLAGRIEGADLLVVNKFGKLEAMGRGLVPAIVAAIERGIPVLAGVGRMNRTAFDGFSSGMAVELPATLDAVLHWCGAGARQRLG
jgi:nucleoside-triphosphatase THEP1